MIGGEGQMTPPAAGFANAELKLPAELSRLPDARNWADTAAEAFGFDEMVRYQIKMAVSEGVANAVEHGSSAPSDEIRLRAVAEGDSLAFYIRDTGKFIPRIPPRGDMPERGRGLAFLGPLMDEVDIKPSPDGTELRFCKRLDG
jgi:anti-sigma regulatory factor (Ser/Thr protein kinase)